MSRTWLRLYTDICESDKLQLIPPEDFRTLINIWCITKDHESELDGWLPSTSKMAWRLRMDSATLEATLHRLRGFGLLEKRENRWRPHDWRVHQYKSDGPSTERAALSKQRKQKSCEIATLQATTNPTLEATTMQRYRAEQSRIDKKKEPPLPPFSEPTQIESAVSQIVKAYPKGISGTLVAQAVVEQAGPDLRHLPAILGNTLAWCAKWGEDPQFTPNLARWLREGAWAKPPTNGHRKSENERILEEITRELDAEAAAKNGAKA